MNQKQIPAPTIDKADIIPGQVDISLAIEYRYKNNMTLQQIADVFSVSRQAVEQRLKSIIKLIGQAEDVKSYDVYRACILTGIERRLVELLIDKRKTKRATLGNVAYAIDKINNIVRAERGQAQSGQAITIQVINYTDIPAQGVRNPDAGSGRDKSSTISDTSGRPGGTTIQPGRALNVNLPPQP